MCFRQTSRITGLANNDQCHEAERAKQLGSVGKLFAEFVTKTAGYLHDHGRTVIFWGEYPMKPDDIGALPNYLVNGEVYGPQFDPGSRHTVSGSSCLLRLSDGKNICFPIITYYRIGALAWTAGGTYEPVRKGPAPLTKCLISSRSILSSATGSLMMGSFVAGVGLDVASIRKHVARYVTGSAAAWHPPLLILRNR